MLKINIFLYRSNSMFKSMVTIIFQIVFYSKIYQNNIFKKILKIIFDISVSKCSKISKKKLSKEKNNKI